MYFSNLWSVFYGLMRELNETNERGRENELR